MKVAAVALCIRTCDSQALDCTANEGRVCKAYSCQVCLCSGLAFIAAIQKSLAVDKSPSSEQGHRQASKRVSTTKPRSTSCICCLCCVPCMHLHCPYLCVHVYVCMYVCMYIAGSARFGMAALAHARCPSSSSREDLCLLFRWAARASCRSFSSRDVHARHLSILCIYVFVTVMRK